MAYISSNNNRFFVALEQGYGQAAAALTAGNRIPAVKLTTKHAPNLPPRKDKTGTRTFIGEPLGLRSKTTYTLRSYMTAWQNQGQAPAHAALFQAALGGGSAVAQANAVASAADASTITFATPHGLVPGNAIAIGSDVRFVAAVVDAHTLHLNAPLSVVPLAGTATTQAWTCQLAQDLGSLSIFDFWSPGSALQRALSGAAVDQMQIHINADYHEFEFSGPAADVLDTTSFEQGQAALTQFPPEPDTSGFDYTIIPGHLGQCWAGPSPNEFLTLTAAKVVLKNNLSLRDDEFGSTYARGIAAGIRTATVDFTVYAQDDASTQALYQAARQRSPVPVMFQLGDTPGQMFAVYMKSVALQVPQVDDSDKLQQWNFQNCRAQGSGDDEIVIAFA